MYQSLKVNASYITKKTYNVNLFSDHVDRKEWAHKYGSPLS